MNPDRDPVTDLRRIAFLLERARDASYRVRAFRTAAAVIAELGAEQTARLAGQGQLRDVKGLGEVTARCVVESLAGEVPVYLRRLEATADGATTDVPTTDVATADGIRRSGPAAERGAVLRAALRGDCHAHSDWSDGGSPISEMAETARDLGHDYLALTDHSPRLTVARGLSADRLRQQLDVVAALNDELAPFRILTGIEVDILADGQLDQADELLARLDLVVASVHSSLRADRVTMTRRMLAAVANPHTDVLGHCTGRLVSGRRRPESDFDAAAVFAACARHRVAVEINSRPERLDPPKRLLRLAVEAGCLVTIDTDAHAPGQLDWLHYGCERAAACGVDPATVVNTWPVDEVLRWTGRARPEPSGGDRP